MQEIRNGDGKLVCRIDPKQSTVEIVSKGQKTVIAFCPESEVRVTNTKIA